MQIRCRAIEKNRDALSMICCKHVRKALFLAINKGTSQLHTLFSAEVKINRRQFKKNISTLFKEIKYLFPFSQDPANAFYFKPHQFSLCITQFF
jgi:hypothetical protein